MLSVFIGYGGAKAEAVARKLEGFLIDTKSVETFLASPQSQTLSPAAHDYDARILQYLIDCHIAVFVCDKSTPRSRELKNELEILFQKNIENKIILFSASDFCIPAKFRKKLWHPLHFAPEKPEESFCRLLNQVYRCFIDIQAPSSMVKETAGFVRQ